MLEITKEASEEVFEVVPELFFSAIKNENKEYLFVVNKAELEQKCQNFVNFLKFVPRGGERAKCFR